MWVGRELVRLVVRIVVVVVVAFAIAAVLALVSVGSFATNAGILLIILGCGLLAMAGVGSGSNIEHYMDRNVMKVAWGTIPGFDAMHTPGEDPTLSPGAALFCSGLVLIVLGIVVF